MYRPSRGFGPAGPAEWPFRYSPPGIHSQPLHRGVAAAGVIQCCGFSWPEPLPPIRLPSDVRSPARPLEGRRVSVEQKVIEIVCEHLAATKSR